MNPAVIARVRNLEDAEYANSQLKTLDEMFGHTRWQPDWTSLEASKEPLLSRFIRVHRCGPTAALTESTTFPDPDTFEGQVVFLRACIVHEDPHCYWPPVIRWDGCIEVEDYGHPDEGFHLYDEPRMIAVRNE